MWSARRVIRMRRICDDALGETAWTRTGRRTSSGVPSGGVCIALALCARVVAGVGPGLSRGAALQWSRRDGGPWGGPGESWNVLSDLVECVAADEPRCCFGRVPRPAEAERASMMMSPGRASKEVI